MHIVCKNKISLSHQLFLRTAAPLYIYTWLYCTVQFSHLKMLSADVLNILGFSNCKLLIAFVQQESLKFHLTLETIYRNHLVYHLAQTRVKFKVISCCSGPCCSVSISFYLLCKSQTISVYVPLPEQDGYLKTGFPMVIAKSYILCSLHHSNCVIF